jgi:DNA polymerase III, delta subunit
MINPKTKLLINGFVNRPNSSLLLIGDKGSGVNAIIEEICNNLLSGIDKYNILTLEPEDGKAVTIEQVRDFKKNLTSKVGSKNGIARIAVVYQANTASHEAQNALLKLIEEPVSKTVLILQSDSVHNLLETIHSRCQIVPVLPITLQQAVLYALSIGASEDDAKRALMISAGKSTIFQEVISGNDHSNDMKNAKLFLGLKIFERLQLQKDYDKKVSLQSLCQNLERIAEAGMHSAGSTSRWKGILEEIRACKALIDHNVTTKLVYIRLCTSV